jgi:hypothetical protein
MDAQVVKCKNPLPLGSIREISREIVWKFNVVDLLLLSVGAMPQ